MKEQFNSVCNYDNNDYLRKEQPKKQFDYVYKKCKAVFQSAWKFDNWLKSEINSDNNRYWLISDCHKNDRCYRESFKDIVYIGSVDEAILNNIETENYILHINIFNNHIEISTEVIDYIYHPNDRYRYEHSYYIYPLKEYIKTDKIKYVDDINNYINVL